MITWKSFFDGEVVEEIVIFVVEILLENYEENTKKIFPPNETFSFKPQYNCHRIEDFPHNIKDQLIQILINCRYSYLALGFL